MTKAFAHSFPVVLLVAAACSGTTPPPPVQPTSEPPSSAAPPPVASAEPSAKTPEPPPPPAPVVDPAKAADCEKLAAAINESGEALNSAAKAYNGAKGKAEPLEKAAATLESASGKIGSVKLQDAKLKKLAEDYAAVYRDMGKAMQEGAKATKAKKPDDFKKSTNEVGRLEAREQLLANEINAYCSK
jgi:hypothetical protein